MATRPIARLRSFALLGKMVCLVKTKESTVSPPRRRLAQCGPFQIERQIVLVLQPLRALVEGKLPALHQ